MGFTIYFKLQILTVIFLTFATYSHCFQAFVFPVCLRTEEHWSNGTGTCSLASEPFQIPMTESCRSSGLCHFCQWLHKIKPILDSPLSYSKPVVRRVLLSIEMRLESIHSLMKGFAISVVRKSEAISVTLVDLLKEVNTRVKTFLVVVSNSAIEQFVRFFSRIAASFKLIANELSHPSAIGSFVTCFGLIRLIGALIRSVKDTISATGEVVSPGENADKRDEISVAQPIEITNKVYNMKMEFLRDPDSGDIDFAMTLEQEFFEEPDVIYMGESPREDKWRISFDSITFRYQMQKNEAGRDVLKARMNLEAMMNTNMKDVATRICEELVSTNIECHMILERNRPDDHRDVNVFHDNEEEDPLRPPSPMKFRYLIPPTETAPNIYEAKIEVLTKPDFGALLTRGNEQLGEAEMGFEWNPEVPDEDVDDDGGPVVIQIGQPPEETSLRGRLSLRFGGGDTDPQLEDITDDLFYDDSVEDFAAAHGEVDLDEGGDDDGDGGQPIIEFGDIYAQGDAVNPGCI